MRRIAYIFALASCLLPSCLLAATYFVSPTGRDTNPGTDALPFATIQKAADLVKAGDVVRVRAGKYAGFSRYGLKGTAQGHIVFVADPGATITGRAAAQPALDVGIEISGPNATGGSSYVDLYNFAVDNSTGTIKGALSAGVRIRFSDHVGVYNCSVRGCGWVGIYCAYVSDVTIDGCVSAQNNLFVDSGTQRNHGIYIANSSRDVTISWCQVYSNNGNGIHLNGDGGVDSGFVIESNQIWANGTLGGSAINCDGLIASRIHWNFVFGNFNKGIALYQIDGARPSSGNLIDSNVVIMPAKSGNSAVQIKDGATSCTLSSNTIIHNASKGVSLEISDDSRQGFVCQGNGYRGAFPLDAGKGNFAVPMGDVDFNGFVTPDDLCQVDSVIGSAEPAEIAIGDVNGDGVVDVKDQDVVKANLGK